MDSYNYLVESLHLNREIEFAFNGKLYFAEPDTNPPLERKYSIWNVETHTCIFSGSIEEMLNYTFEGKYSLNSNYNMFDILFIY